MTEINERILFVHLHIFSEKTKSSPMRELLKALFLFILCLLFQVNIEANTNNQNDFLTGGEENPVYTNEDLKNRVSNLDIPFEGKYSPYVKEKIEEYVQTYRRRTSRILGLSSIYFPIIEQYLKANGLPEALKYLPVIETDLNPKAVSPDGAVGIWQFMPATAEMYGLTFNKEVDERCDIHKSTDAAAKFLKKLYDIYGDWALVLAAYNAGPRRINSAMKRAHSTRFYDIAKYLPEQTRKYVPAFIAVAYAMQYFPMHNIIADNPDLDLQLTKELKVFRELSFDEISMVTGLTLEQLRILNPQCNKDILPANMDGEFLILPKRIIGSFNDYVNLPDARKSEFLKTLTMMQMEGSISNTTYYYKTSYTTEKTDDLESVANLFTVSTHTLKVWNNITDATLEPATEIVIFLPKKVETKLVETPNLKKLKRTKLANITLSSIDNSQKEPLSYSPKLYSDVPYIFYTLNAEESLLEVAIKYGVTLEYLMQTNQINTKNTPLPGTLLKIRELELIRP